MLRALQICTTAQPVFTPSFLSQATANGARSTALHALQWAVGLLLAGISSSVAFNAPQWLLISLVASLIAVMLVFLSSYIYLLIKNPDALRSEQFTLSKIALEKGLVGDSIGGVAKPLPVAQRAQGVDEPEPVGFTDLQPGDWK